MMMELIILVKSEELAVSTQRYNEFYGHCCTAHDMARLSRALTSDEITAIARIREFAKHQNLVFRILRASNLWVRFKFRLGRNPETPVVVCGKKVFHGVPSMRDLARLVS
jgi:hypothetical protein